MKSYRKMRPGIRLLNLLEPIATHLKDECPKCKGVVLIWFDNAAKYKPYYPTGESCIEGCGWSRTFQEIRKEAGLI